MSIRDAIDSAKVAIGTALTMVGTGIAQILDAIPDTVLSKLTIIVGLVVALALAWRHISEARKANIEADILEQKRDRRKQREDQGLPVRRADD